MTTADPAGNPNQAAEQAIARLQTGDLEGARSICLGLLAAHPEHIGGLQVIALAAMRDDRLDEAIVYFNRLLRIHPKPHTYAYLGECYWREGRLSEALAAVEESLAIEPSRSDVVLVRAGVLHGLGRFEESLAAALEAQRLAPASDTACARAGASLERLGRFEEAQQRFEDAARLSSAARPDLKYVAYSGVRFDRALFDRLAIPRVPENPQILGRQGKGVSTGGRFVVLACCDSKYLRKYGFNFVNSFEKNASGRNLLHLHVVDPADDAMALIEKIGRELRPANLVISASESPDSVRAGARRSVYYSCARFLLLPQLLAEYAVPIVCVDIDAIVEAPLDGVVDWANPFDAALIRREPQHSPWLDIPAGILVANPVAPSRAYFGRVRNYLLDFMDRDVTPWHIDQAALYCVYRMMERYDEVPNVGWLPQAASSCVWQMGHSYDSKLLEARFARYSPSAGAGKSTFK